RNGKVITFGFAPSLSFSVTPSVGHGLNPLVLTAGTWPSGPHQIAIDAHTASSKHYAVGDTIGAVARGPQQKFKIAGIVKLGNVTSIGGATMAIFDLPTSQKLFGKEGKLDSISVAAKPGVSPSKLVSEIKPLLPPTAQVRTGQAEAAKQTQDTSDFADILQKFLLA